MTPPTSSVRYIPVQPETFPVSILSAPAPLWGRVAQGASVGVEGGTPPMYPALGTDTFPSQLYDVKFNPLDQTTYDIQLYTLLPGEDTWSIPGTTKIKDQNCGIVIRWVACSHDPTHWKQPMVEHCDRVECPECWTYWGIKQAKRMAGRLRGYIADAQEHLIGYDWHKTNAQNLRHWVFSPPSGVLVPTQDYDTIKVIGKKFVLAHGVTGGVLVFHPWRIREEVVPLLVHKLQTHKLSDEDKEKKFWQAAREDILGIGNWRQYCYWSPHYHVIGFGYVQDARQLHSETGWVYKHIRNVRVQVQRKPDGLDDQIAALCFYVISHAAYQWTKKIPAWFGCCTPRNLKKMGDPVPSEFDGMKLVCPKCAARIVEYQDDAGKIGEKKLSEEGEEIYRTIKDEIQKYQIIDRGGG